MADGSNREGAQAPKRGEISDLIGVELALGVGIGVIVVFAGFFFVGPVVGIVLLLAAIGLAIALTVRALRRAEVPDER